jgi:hypothetical protein
MSPLGEMAGVQTQAGCCMLSWATIPLPIGPPEYSHP